MANYKRDINLFKAAGGAVSKGKKMPLTKKLFIVMIGVVIVLGAVIGVLNYLYQKDAKKLKAAETKGTNYDFTKTLTEPSLKEYEKVSSELNIMQAIEYYNESNNKLISCLSDAEIDAVKTYFMQSGIYSLYYSFDEVIDSLISTVGKAQYQLDNYADDYSARQNNLQYIYSALCYMKNNAELYRLLHAQTTEGEVGSEYEGWSFDGIWYCYYRGQIIFILKGGQEGNLDSIMAELTDGEHLIDASRSVENGYQYKLSPFMSMTDTISGSSSLLDLNCSYCFTLKDPDDPTQETNYSIFCITRKNAVERIFQAIENCITTDKEFNENNAGFDYTYHILNLEYDAFDDRVTFTLSMNQGDEFGLDDICQALDTCGFFRIEQNYAYETTDQSGILEETIVLKIVRKPYEIMDEEAPAYFVKEEE